VFILLFTRTLEGCIELALHSLETITTQILQCDFTTRKGWKNKNKVGSQIQQDNRNRSGHSGYNNQKKSSSSSSLMLSKLNRGGFTGSLVAFRGVRRGPTGHSLRSIRSPLGESNSGNSGGAGAPLPFGQMQVCVVLM
jgi:hypothetical protein